MASRLVGRSNVSGSLHAHPVAHVHRDANGPDAGKNVTALLYPNSEWDASCAGETVFFSEAEDARVAVLPRPGRLLLFVASILHVGRAPSRAC